MLHREGFGWIEDVGHSDPPTGFIGAGSSDVEKHK